MAESGKRAVKIDGSFLLYRSLASIPKETLESEGNHGFLLLLVESFEKP